MLRRGSIERVEFISGEPHGHHLHRLGATAWASAAATLQFLDVVARFCLVGPLLDLLVTHYANIV